MPENNINQKAIDTLHRENCSCVVAKDGKINIYRGPGISDLLRLLCDEPEKLSGAFVADKVIGKAAASLLILGKVDSVYTDLISDGAVELLARSDIKADYRERVHVILNRTKEDLCPMEKLCMDALDAAECYNRITEFIKKNHKK